MNIRSVSLFAFLAVLAILANYVGAQENTTPTPNLQSAKTPLSEEWVGEYEGELEIFDGGGKPVGKTPMRVEVGAAEAGAARPFRIIYGEPGKSPVRDYQLVATGTADNHFLNDERSGILIDTYLVGDTLYSQFEVSGARVDSRFKKDGDAMLTEMVTYGVTAQRDTRPTFDNSMIVRSYELQNVQKARLTRKPAPNPSGK